MRSLFVAMTAFAGLLVAGVSSAADAPKAQTHHVSKKAECRKEAKEQGLKGAEAKRFVKNCVAQQKAPKEDKPAVSQ